jgi:hypothetical protein
MSDPEKPPEAAAAETPPTPPSAVEEPKVEENPLVKVKLREAIYINGKQYGPGDCEVPADTFHVYKNVLEE